MTDQEGEQPQGEEYLLLPEHFEKDLPKHTRTVAGGQIPCEGSFNPPREIEPNGDAWLALCSQPDCDARLILIARRGGYIQKREYLLKNLPPEAIKKITTIANEELGESVEIEFSELGDPQGGTGPVWNPDERCVYINRSMNIIHANEIDADSKLAMYLDRLSPLASSASV